MSFPLIASKIQFIILYSKNLLFDGLDNLDVWEYGFQ